MKAGKTDFSSPAKEETLNKDLPTNGKENSRNNEIDTNKVTKTFSPTEIDYLVHCFKN